MNQQTQEEPLISPQEWAKLNQEDMELFISVLSEDEKKSIAGLFSTDESGKVKWTR